MRRLVLSEDFGQGGLEILLLETVAGGLEFDGFDALAGEEERPGHFAEGDAQGDGWRGEECWAVQDAGKHAGEVSILYGAGRDEVVGAAPGWHVDRAADDSDNILQGDPGQPLSARTEAAAEAELKRRDHGGKGANLG